MTAKSGDAVGKCKALLDNGSRNEKVYFKLASTYHEIGDTRQRDAVLKEALRLHPTDSDLLRLNTMINSASQEDLELQRARQKDTASLNRGLLKLTCLSDDSVQGLTACRQYLSVADDSRVRDRLASLQLQYAQPTPKPLTPTPPATQNEIPENRPLPPQSSPQFSDTTEADNERKRFKDQARRIQSYLTNLGFSVGAIDGDPGRKTISALHDFYAAMALPPRTSIDAFTENDLDDATVKLNNAQRLLEQSKRLQEQGKLQEALDSLISADSESPLLLIPEGYRASLSITPPTTEDPIIVPKPPSIPATPVPTPAPENNTEQDRQLQQLLVQINITRNQLAKQRQSEKSQLQAFRSIVILDD